MNISEIFKIINLPYNNDNLYNIKSTNLGELKKINSSIPEKKYLYEISSFLNVSPDTLYLTENFLEPLVFLDLENFYYMNIPSFDINFCKSIGLEKNISKIKEKTDKILKEKRYSYFFSFIDKKISLLFFQNIIGQLPNQEAYDIFLELYSRNDYALKVLNIDFIKNILEKNEQKIIIPNVSNDTEKIVVYRGQTNSSTPINKAISWTINKDIAKFFANRFKTQNNNSTLYTATINIKDVKAYIKHEEEIIAYPKDITIIKKENI